MTAWVDNDRQDFECTWLSQPKEASDLAQATRENSDRTACLQIVQQEQGCPIVFVEATMLSLS
jgi:hypothetical protein